MRKLRVGRETKSKPAYIDKMRYLIKISKKIYQKIESAFSMYRKDQLDTDWRENRKYINNLKKK
jgi:hypothetical protein